MARQLFLSASIPIRGRQPFDGNIQIKRIRDAVLAMVNVCKDQELILVFGGHPAISPLIHHAAESLGVMEHIYIYQSEFFKDMLPDAARKFPNLKWTPPGSDLASSVAKMRDAMIDSRTWDYQFAVFIGGMEGILDEARRFHEAFPDKPMVPLQLTGGATAMLVKEFADYPWTILEFEESATSTLRCRRMLDRIFAGE